MRRHLRCCNPFGKPAIEKSEHLTSKKNFAADIKTFSLSVCAFVCVIQMLSVSLCVSLSYHPFVPSLAQKKANMPVNSRRHIGFTSNLKQIKTTEGGVAHRNTHAINHISFSLVLALFVCFSPSGTLPHVEMTNREERKRKPTRFLLSVQLSTGFKLYSINKGYCT